MVFKKLHLFLFLLIHAHVLVSQNGIQFTEEEQEWIKNHPTVNFGYEKSWPPFEIYENGYYKGISGEYINIIEKETGIKMEPIPNITWAESINKIQKGEINVVAVSAITTKRLQKLVFTEPHIADFLVIVTHKDYEFVNGLKGLENKTVSIPKGYHTIKMINRDYPNINIKEASGIKVCLEDVKNRKTDAVVASLAVLTYYIKRDGYTNLKIASPTSYEQQKYSFGVTKNWIVFRDIVQKVFNSISPHQKQQFYKKWVNPTETKYVIGVSKLKSYILYGLSILSVLFLMFYLWNKSLKKQIKIKDKAEANLKASLKVIKEKTAEKTVLLKEIHHRVKNNLQLVNSMLNMQARKVDDPLVKGELLNAQNRVMAMSLIHKSLNDTDKLDQVNVAEYVNILIKNLKKTVECANNNVKFNIDIDGVVLNIDDVIPLGLILNELMVNSCKHAFSGDKSGEIKISIQKQTDKYCFKYSDSGSIIKKRQVLEKNNLGIFLIHGLMKQLNAKDVIEDPSNFSIRFNFKGVSI